MPPFLFPGVSESSSLPIKLLFSSNFTSGQPLYHANCFLRIFFQIIFLVDEYNPYWFSYSTCTFSSIVTTSGVLWRTGGKIASVFGKDRFWVCSFSLSLVQNHRYARLYQLSLYYFVFLYASPNSVVLTIKARLASVSNRGVATTFHYSVLIEAQSWVQKMHPISSMMDSLDINTILNIN